MKSGKILCTILLFYFAQYPLQAWSQENHLDLSQLMKLALKKNVDIQFQHGETQIAEYQRRQSVSQMLPQADLEGGLIKSSGRNGAPLFIAANGLYEKYAWLSLQQPIFNASNVMNVMNSHIEQHRLQ